MQAVASETSLDSPDETRIPPNALVLVSTPIGNLGDLSGRAVAALREADLILCEDTRHSGPMLRRLGARANLEALHDHNEDTRIAPILARLRGGERIALISDAGTPLMSDPGYRLTRAVIAAGLPVTAIPGANAALTALVLSGLPPHPYLFLGFPPARDAARLQALTRLRAAEAAGLRATLIWHEAPHRLVALLVDLVTIFGNRPGAVARELTKRFETLHRDTLPALLAHFTAEPARGELTVLVGPALEADDTPVDLDAQLRDALGRMSVRDAAAVVATASGRPRKLVYARALELARRGD
jgi:16S rRNA (cytidine1402-2'-O)-methyltransferase